MINTQIFLMALERTIKVYEQDRDHLCSGDDCERGDECWFMVPRMDAQKEARLARIKARARSTLRTHLQIVRDSYDAVQVFDEDANYVILKIPTDRPVSTMFEIKGRTLTIISTQCEGGFSVFDPTQIGSLSKSPRTDTST